MPATPPHLVEIGTRHQVYLERVKSHESKAFESFLREMDRDINKRLQGKDITAFTRKRLETLIANVREDLKAIWGGYRGVYRDQMAELAIYESGFEVRSLNQVVKYDFNLPTTSQLKSAVFSRPLSVTGPDNGKILESFYRDWSQKSIDRIEGAIRAGYYQGQTTSQILQSIRGTRANRFMDGKLQMSNTDASMLVRTGLQHVAGVARNEVWEQNKDIVKGWRLSVTFDGRTSPICRDLGQAAEIYPLGSGPFPPLHVGCRSGMVAALDERFAILDEGATRFARGEDGVSYVDAKMGYYDFLKTQSAKFQDSAIGPTRGKLLRNGGLSSERFAELGLGKNFEPLTIAEMRKLEPLAFERAGL